MRRYVFLILLIISFLIPQAALAQCPSFSPWGLQCDLLPCGPNRGKCDNLCQLLELGQNITFFGLNLAVFVLTPIFLLAGGIMLVVAGGSTARVSTGKKFIWGAVVGALIAMGAFAIIDSFFWGLGISGLAPGSTWSNIRCNL